MAHAMAISDELILRRVVVALDAAADFPATLEMAASVAACLGVGLHALFVEDESLRRVARLPFAQQVDAMTAARSALNEADLDAELKSLARQVRRELERVAGTHALQWSLEVSRAVIGPEALPLAGDELLVFAATSRPAARTLRLSSPWRRLADRMTQPFLLVPERPTTSGPIAVMYDTTMAGRRALDASLRIARRAGRPLIVAVPEALTPTEYREVQMRSQDATASITLLRVPVISRKTIEALVAASRVTMVVIGRDGGTAVEPMGVEPFAPFSALLVL
jgi:hypothetical protein